MADSTHLFLSQLRPLRFQADSTHLLLLASTAWWVALVLFAPLGQVILMHDLSSALLSPVGHPAPGLPSPLGLLASVWPLVALAALMILCGLVATLRHFNAFLRWCRTLATHRELLQHASHSGAWLLSTMALARIGVPLNRTQKSAVRRLEVEAHNDVLAALARAAVSLSRECGYLGKPTDVTFGDPASQSRAYDLPSADAS